MKGLMFELTCPDCGAEMVQVANGKPIGGREVRCIIECTKCPSEQIVLVRLVATRAPRAGQQASAGHEAGLAECGTDGAYRRHLRHQEDPCARCREAHAIVGRTQAKKRQSRSKEFA